MSSPLPGWLRPVSVPTSWIYASGVRIRNRRYDRASNVRALPVPVISVGNITTGGVGKTPTVMWIVDHLMRHGHRPVIGMRGYGAKPGELSDEEAEYMLRVPGVDVVVNPNRYEALRDYLGAHPEADCVVLDDGFQRRQLQRDLDLVLVDASRDTFRERLLPAGHLREPLTNLRRADAIIVTHAPEIDAALARDIERWHGRAPVAWSQHRWAHLQFLGPGGSENHPVERLRGMRVAVMLGIGNPDAMRRQIEDAGASIVADFHVRDHQHYDRRLLERVREAAGDLDAVILTNKDWVKIEQLIELNAWPVPIVVPQLMMDVYDGRRVLEDLIDGTVEAWAAATPPASHPAGASPDLSPRA